MSNLLRADWVSSSQTFTTAWLAHQRAVARNGDTVVAVFAYGAAAAPTDPTTLWTGPVTSSQSALAYISTFTKGVSADGAADYSFTGPANRPFICWCGVIAGSLASSVNNGGSSASASPTSATPVSAGSLVVGITSFIRNGSVTPPVTGTKWRRRCSGFSGSDSSNTAAYLGVYIIDNAAAAATPALAVGLPTSTAWAAQTLVFAPGAQPAVTTLSDVRTPYAGAWLPMAVNVPVAGAWV